MKNIKPQLLMILSFISLIILGLIFNSIETARFIGSIAGVSIDPSLLITAIFSGIFSKKYKEFLIYYE